MERGTHVTQAVGYHQHPEAVPAPPVPKVDTVQTSSASGHTAAGVVWPEAELLSTRGLCYTVVVVQSLSHSYSLQPHGLQHAGLLCPPLSPRVCSDSCSLSRWCYLTHYHRLISSLKPPVMRQMNQTASHPNQKLWPETQTDPASTLPLRPEHPVPRPAWQPNGLLSSKKKNTFFL